MKKNHHFLFVLPDVSDDESIYEPEEVKRAWEELMTIQREQQRYIISFVYHMVIIQLYLYLFFFLLRIVFECKRQQWILEVSIIFKPYNKANRFRFNKCRIDYR